MATKNGSVDGGDNKIKVAIIGGGIAGLSCAQHLSKLSDNFEPTVFDTGRLRSGGRCSSRLPGDKAKNRKESKDRILNRFVIDHAAQILSVSNDREFLEFQKQVGEWENEGLIRKFPQRSVVEIIHDRKLNDSKNGSPVPPFVRYLNDYENNETKNRNKSEMYYGVNGMGSIASAIAYPAHDDDKPLFRIEQDVWISPSNGVKFIGTNDIAPKWTVQTNGKRFGSYDMLVIAHNGKCADRLMSRTPAKQLHSLLRTNFSPTVPAWGGKNDFKFNLFIYICFEKRFLANIQGFEGRGYVSIY